MQLFVLRASEVLLLTFSFLIRSSTLDVKDVGFVIVRACSLLSKRAVLTIAGLQNYDFPNNCEDYIHRIGRTGVSFGLPC